MTSRTPLPSEAMRPAEEQAWQRHLATMPEGARRNVMESAARGESETRKAHSSAYLAALASTQAAEVERLTRERDELNDARNAAIELANARFDALKAKQIDVEAVMRLAEGYANSEGRARGCDINYVHTYRKQSDAAREALRASLLGDGGTL